MKLLSGVKSIDNKTFRGYTLRYKNGQANQFLIDIMDGDKRVGKFVAFLHENDGEKRLQIQKVEIEEGYKGKGIMRSFYLAMYDYCQKTYDNFKEFHSDFIFLRNKKTGEYDGFKMRESLVAQGLAERTGPAEDYLMPATKDKMRKLKSGYRLKSVEVDKGKKEDVKTSLIEAEEVRSVNNFSQEKIETIIGRKIENAAQMERIQKVHDMNFENENGRDGILPPGLYVDENGKLQTNFTEKQLVIKRQELMKDGMYTKKEANALLENYVCGNVMPADLVVQFLGNKIAKLLRNMDKNMTPQQAQAKLDTFMKIFTKFERYSLSDEYTDVY